MSSVSSEDSGESAHMPRLAGAFAAHKQEVWMLNLDLSAFLGLAAFGLAAFFTFLTSPRWKDPEAPVPGLH